MIKIASISVVVLYLISYFALRLGGYLYYESTMGAQKIRPWYSSEKNMNINLTMGIVRPAQIAMMVYYPAIKVEEMYRNNK